MRDLTETIAGIILSVVLIAATYSLFGAWLTSAITTAFSGVNQSW